MQYSEDPCTSAAGMGPSCITLRLLKICLDVPHVHFNKESRLKAGNEVSEILLYSRSGICGFFVVSSTHIPSVLRPHFVNLRAVIILRRELRNKHNQ